MSSGTSKARGKAASQASKKRKKAHEADVEDTKVAKKTRQKVVDQTEQSVQQPPPERQIVRASGNVIGQSLTDKPLNDIQTI